MASAVILTYERKSSFSRNTSMRKTHNGFSVDSLAPERSYTSETMADSSETRRSRRPITNAPCVAQNFTTKSNEPPSETASEDSCSLKRKSMSLNGNRAKDLGLGVSLRDLSRIEKRQLRRRIKMDLQQVRSLTLKIEARENQVKGSSLLPLSRSGMNGSATGHNGLYIAPAAESSFGSRMIKKPSVVIPEVNMELTSTTGKDKRTPKANQLYVNSEYLSGKDKLPPVEKNKSKFPGSTKRSINSKVDPRDIKRPKVDISHSKKVSELLKQCGFILKKLMAHKFAWVFNEPVDAVKLNLHDYHKIIKKPMDLGTIKNKLDAGVYLLPSEFCDDVRLTFANAMRYNPPGHDVYYMAETLKGLFESKWKPLEDKLRDLDTYHDRYEAETEPKDAYSAPQSEPPLPPVSTPSIAAPPSAARPVASPAPARKPKPSVMRSTTKSKPKPVAPPKREMTFEEKQKLSEYLGNLPPDKLDQAVQIMRKNPNLMQNDDEIEVDIESFDTETLWELHRFVMDCNVGRNQEELPAQSAQAANANQFSNGMSKNSRPGQRGSDAGEEEVDIEDDMPAKEFPPVVIEKDRGIGIKNSSSSSSSSESGSSSSDSDSGSSSGSDSEADEGHSKISSADKEPVGSSIAGDQMACPTREDDGIKSSPNNVPEENPSRPSGNDSEVANEAKDEVCPERQARAALLRSRFADTILKAHEKTLPLNKGEKVDPEKLKRDQEELERRRKEEKARLQAEAKANELARIRAEQAAAAEARRQREAMREAARLELQNMEKSVEIDESAEVMKDLERLRSGPPEYIPSSGDETSPVRSPNGFSGFTFEGSNPLERLGLFMRSDEDEEEVDIDAAQAPRSSS